MIDTVIICEVNKPARLRMQAGLWGIKHNLFNLFFSGYFIHLLIEYFLKRGLKL